MLIEAGLIHEQRLVDLTQEANEIVAILIASVKTARRNMTKPK
jgi:hypothetical protein